MFDYVFTDDEGRLIGVLIDFNKGLIYYEVFIREVHVR